MNEYSDDGVQPVKHNLEQKEVVMENITRYRAMAFMALINIGECCIRSLNYVKNKKSFSTKILLSDAAVIIALGLLTIWHALLIKRGETSIEAHINSSESKRLANMGKIFKNPYDFGPKKNFQIFLGLTNGR